MLANLTGPPLPRSLEDVMPTAEFAPNAYSTSPQYASGPSHGASRWMDRLMNILMGEDETQPINRLALICLHCRLVNGQAPPGVRNLEDVGLWRCSGCRRLNGQESEAKRIADDISKQAKGKAADGGGTAETRLSSGDEAEAGPSDSDDVHE